MDMGEKIRQARTDKGMTQTALAAALGVSNNTIRRYESGEVRPREAKLYKLAEILEVQPTELMSDPVNIKLWPLTPNLVSEPKQQIVEKNAAQLMDILIEEMSKIDNFSEWLRSKNVYLNDDDNTVIMDDAIYHLTQEQYAALPDMSLEQICGLIRSLARQNTQ